jgi:hypothetical protein
MVVASQCRGHAQEHVPHDVFSIRNRPEDSIGGVEYVPCKSDVEFAQGVRATAEDLMHELGKAFLVDSRTCAQSDSPETCVRGAGGDGGISGCLEIERKFGAAGRVNGLY